MYKYLFDWYKIVNTNPDEMELEKRKDVIKDIIKVISESSDWDYLADCVICASLGVEFLPADSTFTQEIIKIHQSHLLAFPTAPSENALELKVACAVSIGEIINKETDRKDDSPDEALLAACLFLSACSLAPQPTEKYIIEMLEQLRLVAEDICETRAKRIRRRQSVNYSQIEKISLPSEPDAWNGFVKNIVEIFQLFEQQALADREELEILWWYKNGISIGLELPLNDLSPIVSAIRIGVELADKTTPPPLKGICTVIEQSLEKGRRKEDLENKPLKQFIKKHDLTSWELLVPRASSLYEFIRKFPSIFPLSWLGIRLHESGGSTSWKQEFEKHTGITVDRQTTVNEVALQIFHEQILKSIYLDLTED